MEIINVTGENIETEHICCAIANDRDCQVRAKKDWLTRRFADGLVFQKLNVRSMYHCLKRLQRKVRYPFSQCVLRRRNRRRMLRRPLQPSACFITENL